MPQPQEEKRSTRRFSLRLPIQFDTVEHGNTIAYTRDVSARGICFYVDSPISEGAPIRFTLTLPQEVTLTEAISVQCRGRVVRVEPVRSNGSIAVAAIIDHYDYPSKES